MTFLTRFLGATLLAAASLASHAQAPQPPEIAAKSYLLVDVTAGQTLAAKYHYRPSRPEAVPAELVKAFPAIKLVSIDDPIFGGGTKVQPAHFDDGGIFDQIYRPAN